MSGRKMSTWSFVISVKISSRGRDMKLLWNLIRKGEKENHIPKMWNNTLCLVFKYQKWLALKYAINWINELCCFDTLIFILLITIARTSVFPVCGVQKFYKQSVTSLSLDSYMMPKLKSNNTSKGIHICIESDT